MESATSGSTCVVARIQIVNAIFPKSSAETAFNQNNAKHIYSFIIDLDDSFIRSGRLFGLL
jgi:hypothetical protein